MKTKTLISTFVGVSIAALNPWVHGQGFNSGSTGKDGALNVTVDMTLNLPPDGILNYTTIHVNTGTTLRFNANQLNTPVYLLALGDVTIDGIINVSAGDATRATAGKGGPGGFDGGSPSLGEPLSGDGKGPGGGKGGPPGFTDAGAGGGSYATLPPNPSANDGLTYGSRVLVPLVGGSGGGGAIGVLSTEGGGGGGGGGGAILIASNTRIILAGQIQALGGNGASGFNSGSGGAIRLVAPTVQGSGSFDVSGFGGAGRTRIDTIDKSQLPLPSNPSAHPEAFSVGSFMTVFPPNNPRLDIIEAAGTTIAEGVASPVTVTLPFGSDPNRTITVQARNFKAVVPIEVVLTPDNGPGTSVKAQIDNAAANPAIVKVPVTFPLNTPVTVNAWIR